MKMPAPLIILVLTHALTVPLVASADAGERRGGHTAAWAARREGRILPVREIERRIAPTMKGAQYLGFDFDSDSAIYTLKFLRDGTVIWVDVDGRSGQVVGRTDR